MTSQTLGNPMPDPIGNFTELLTALTDRGYDFVFFEDELRSHGQVILRHDIDFSTECALEMAQIEHRFGVEATYFFLLRSSIYNPYCTADYDNICRIRSLGHKISVHFDPVTYDNFEDGLHQERKMFMALFDEDVTTISLHRPNPYFQQHNEPIAGVMHTYQDKFFKDIKYLSDSTGLWRYGSPLNSDEFHAKQTLHVLIHPIWWTTEGSDNREMIKNHFFHRVGMMKSEFIAQNTVFAGVSDEC